MYDVLIIGGGVIGTTIARQLSRYRLKIALLESNSCLGANTKNTTAAIIHGGYAEPYQTLKGRLCYQGRLEFQQLDQELDFGFRPTGALVIAALENQLKELKFLYNNGTKNGLDDLELLDRGQTLALEPRIHPSVMGSLHCAGAGICSPHGLITSAMLHGVQNGVHLHLNSRVIEIERLQDLFLVTTNTQERFLTRFLVNATGLASDSIGQMVGIIPLDLQKQPPPYLCSCGEKNSLLHKIIFQLPGGKGNGTLIAPTVHWNVMVEPNTPNDLISTHEISPKRLYNIYQQVLHNIPELDIHHFLKTFVGIHPVHRHSDFVIEESSMVPRLIQIHGVQSQGITASPAIAHRVAGLLADAGLSLVRDPSYNPYRISTTIPKRQKCPAPPRGNLLTLPTVASRKLPIKAPTPAIFASIIPFSSLSSPKESAGGTVQTAIPHQQGSSELLELSPHDLVSSPTYSKLQRLSQAEQQELLAYFKSQHRKENI